MPASERTSLFRQRLLRFAYGHARLRAGISQDYKKEIPGHPRQARTSAGNDNEAESSAKACFRITEAIKSSPVRGMTKAFTP